MLLLAYHFSYAFVYFYVLVFQNSEVPVSAERSWVAQDTLNLTKAIRSIGAALEPVQSGWKSEVYLRVRIHTRRD